MIRVYGGCQDHGGHAVSPRWVFPTEQVHGQQEVSIAPGANSRVVFVRVLGHEGRETWFSVTPGVAKEIGEAFGESAEIAGKSEFLY